MFYITNGLLTIGARLLTIGTGLITFEARLITTGTPTYYDFLFLLRPIRFFVQASGSPILVFVSEHFCLRRLRSGLGSLQRQLKKQTAG